MSGKRKAVVTGAAGFIGSHLVERLVAEGWNVTGLDNFDPFYEPEIKRRNLKAVSASPDFRLVEGDIRDPEALDRAMKDGAPDVVVHLAARAGVRPSIEDPVGYVSVNLDGTVQVLEACRRHAAKKLIFGSSSSVYGNNRKVPFSEDDPVDHPISPYAATKKAGELLCHTYHHLSGIPVACLRFFTVFGPRQRPDLAIHRFARILVEGGTIPQFGDGSSSRDYTYIDDIVEGIVRAMDRCAAFHVWNLGGAHTTRLSDLIRKVGQGMGVEPRIQQLPPQPGDVERTWADVSRADQELGWKPRIGLDEGLTRFFQWFREDGTDVSRQEDR